MLNSPPFLAAKLNLLFVIKIRLLQFFEKLTFSGVRPNEYDQETGQTELSSGESGTSSQEATYIKPKETTLDIKRKFTVPGIEYKLVLFSYNMHNEDDFAKLTWRIQCANPIVPEDWKLHYEPFLHSDTSFNMSLTIEKEKVCSLPCKIFS